MKNKSVVTIILIVVGIIGLMFLFAKYIENSNKPNPFMDSFAQCIASKNLTMYGAEWCSHCKKEKALFGQSFKYIPYVECPDNTKLCLDKGITGYPTWIDSKGVKYEGEQGLDGLEKISECKLQTK